MTAGPEIARRIALALFFIGAGTSCLGRIADGDDEVDRREGEGTAAGPAGRAEPGSEPAPNTAPSLASPRAFGRLGLRRLSRNEYRQTIEDALGITVGPDIELLPADAGEPFENDYTKQLVSAAWIEGAKAIADRIAARLIGDEAARARLAGCAPGGPADAKCLTQFAGTVGRRLLRRPLAPGEITELLAFQSFAQKDGNFWTAASLVTRALLQDLEFLHRIEIGTPAPGQDGLHRLGDFEVATRLSYLLWGTGPDDVVLDLAARGGLGTGKQIQEAAATMLQSPKALRQMRSFHAAWLGYETLSDALTAESNALVERVVFKERGSWLDLFTSRETWISSSMQAAIYGLAMPPSGQPGWVSYGDAGRKGILAHGSVLSNGATATDTSPTLRGLFLRMRVMCDAVPPPPPNVDADLPPAGARTPCKPDRYAAHRTDPACAACHSLFDSLGFGLENYDATGRYRTREPGSFNCPIQGQGEVPGLGTFRGPAELADLLVKSGKLDRCLSKQLYQYAVGRPEGSGDDGASTPLAEQLERSGHKLDQLVLALVGAPAFQHRWVE